mgnify:CR=1 FL=1
MVNPDGSVVPAAVVPGVTLRIGDLNHIRQGRHTTTHRELVILPNGGLIIDTPGMRELQLWDVNEAVRETFDDVETLAAHCHFTDCRHRDEPRCAVKAAVTDGRLAADRLHHEAMKLLRNEPI